jgi:hypothetical protein
MIAAMNVHIIRDEDCPLAIYQNVFEKLSKSPGFIRFVKSKDDALLADDAEGMSEEKEGKPINKYHHFLSFSQLYAICENYRSIRLIKMIMFFFFQGQIIIRIGLVIWIIRKIIISFR